MCVCLWGFFSFFLVGFVGFFLLGLWVFLLLLLLVFFGWLSFFYYQLLPPVHAQLLHFHSCACNAFSLQHYKLSWARLLWCAGSGHWQPLVARRPCYLVVGLVGVVW